MSTRWIVFGLRFFAVSALVALAVAVVGPLPAIRFFGYVALTCAAAGIALNLYALRDADPHGWTVLRYRVNNLAEQMGMRWRAAHRHDVPEVQR
jgi:hypothetical protein